MTEPTDTNQASEDESKKPSERKRLFDRLIFMFGWKGETRRNKANKMMKIIDQYTETIIRTEKLKLLAEVKSSLTQLKELKENRDDKGVLWGSYDVVDLDDIREVLTELEAEL